MTRKHPQKNCRRNWTRNVLVHLARGSVAHQLPGPAQGRVRALEVVLPRHDQRPGLLREAREVGAVEEVGPRMMFRQSTQSISGQPIQCHGNVNPISGQAMRSQPNSCHQPMGISFTVQAACISTNHSCHPIQCHGNLFYCSTLYYEKFGKTHKAGAKGCP